MATVCPFIDRASKSAQAFPRQCSHRDFQNIINPQFSANFETMQKKQKISFKTHKSPSHTPSRLKSPLQPQSTVTRNNHAHGETINMYCKKDLSRESVVRSSLAPAQKTVSERAFIFGPSAERMYPHDGLVRDTVTHTAVEEGRRRSRSFYFKCLYCIRRSTSTTW